MNKLINLNVSNIWTAIKDYGRHADTTVLNDVSDAFVERLAEDSAYAKTKLRNLFCQSDAWNYDLQAIVINGTKTHDPDYSLIRSLAEKILNPATQNFDLEKRALVDSAIAFFSCPDDYVDGITAIQELAPNAYRPNKKKSRMFKALCDSLGVTDLRAGSSFQKLFADLADEMNGRKLPFKLFVSLNPAHFVTMSNPKHDSRGKMLVSCHSFNSTEFTWNCGCAGYARDDVTFIVFTASDPDNPETLNNRKLTRQLFMYKPNNGLLLQSRLYDTHGGTRGHQADSDLYRDLIQRELSKLEGVPNLWKTESYVSNKRHIYLESALGFGGYEDWIYPEFDAKISIRADHEHDFQTFEIGTYGLCIVCAEEISEKLYCSDCDPDGNSEVCDECGCRTDNITGVLNEYGERIYVCPACLEEGHSYCCHCDEYYPASQMTLVDSTYVCPNCVIEYCETCAECGEIHHNNSLHDAYDRYGNAVLICDDCRYESYRCCEYCGTVHHEDNLHCVHGRYNSEINVCDNCFNNYYDKCERCGKYFYVDDLTNGLCSDCRCHEEEDNK